MRRVIVLSLIIILCIASGVQATTYTWNGSAGDGDWTNTANWDDGLAPTSLSAAGGADAPDIIIFDGSNMPTTNPGYSGTYNNDSATMIFNSGGEITLDVSDSFQGGFISEVNPIRTILTIGDGSGASASVTVNVTNMNSLLRHNSYTANFLVKSDGLLNFSNNLELYNDNNKHATFTLDGGSIISTGFFDASFNTQADSYVEFFSGGGSITAAYGGAFADFAAVQADASGVFVDTAGNGLEFADNGSSFTVSAAGKYGAHTPTPESGETVLAGDVASLADPSWLSPLQAKDGSSITEPNIVSVDGYYVWWSVGEEPNYLTDTPVYQDAADQDYTPAESITYDTTYFWRVDTLVTFDTNDFTGIADTQMLFEGLTWQFSTEPEYIAPVIETFDNVLTTTDIGYGRVVANIASNTDSMNAPTFTILTDAAGFPGGSPTLVDDTPMDNQNPGTTLYASEVGTYYIKLVTDDGTTAMEDIVAVEVVEDACQAAKDYQEGWQADYFDVTGPVEDVPDCIVNLLDFAELALDWLGSTELAEQVAYATNVSYYPQAVYDVRIEAEWFDPNDPNAFSGCLIQENEVASGGQNIGNNGDGSWVDYDIDVPAAAVGVPVDAYIGYALASGTRVVSFGIEGEGAEALYGTAEALSSDSWVSFVGHQAGQVTFTADGVQTIRVTCSSGGLNLDWFSFDWPE